MRTDGSLSFWQRLRSSAGPFRPLKTDWYVLSEVLGPFIGGLIFFSFVFLMSQLLRMAELFIIHGVGGLILGKLIGLMLVTFMPYTLPIAFLISILTAFGRLSADSELVAMKSGGLSVLRLAYPVIALSLIVSGLTLGLNVRWVPWAERNLRGTIVRVGNTKVVKSIKEGTFTSGFFDLLIFAEKVDPKTNHLSKVFLYDEREPKNPLTVVAREGEIIPVKTGSELGVAAVLRLRNGSIHKSDVETDTYQKVDFGEYRLFLKVKEGEDATVVKPRMYSNDELLMRLKREKYQDGLDALEMRGEYWRRYAVSITPLIFVFLGIGFGTIRTRAVRASAALVAFVVIAVFWTVQLVATVIVQKNWLPAYFAMEIPNLILLTAATFGFRRATW